MIYFVSEGGVIEKGTHAELIAKGGAYVSDPLLSSHAIGTNPSVRACPDAESEQD